MFFEIINQYYCIIFLQRLSHYYFFAESFSFYELFDSYQSGFFNISWFPWLFTQEYFSWQSSGIERFYPAYLLLLNLINTVRFSQTMTVIQFAAINLILISLILCQTLKLWWWQFILYFFCQDIKRFYMSMTKLIINGLGCFFSSQQLYANSVLFYCLTKNSLYN